MVRADDAARAEERRGVPRLGLQFRQQGAGGRQALRVQDEGLQLPDLGARSQRGVSGPIAFARDKRKRSGKPPMCNGPSQQVASHLPLPTQTLEPYRGVRGIEACSHLHLPRKVMIPQFVDRLLDEPQELGARDEATRANPLGQQC